ncbi:hypothetical protein [Mesorhizobium sp. B263B2A]|uniref:hypothetical protein n=1 Tax=Mesorhizobium sp. B263B2A TaxID=2876669 RepID=UPI001CD1183C|nr:hypothetical protein [Mesorhizobium sp. B263B2A]MCA0032709.1 hypothetical protein [Mesorhizobium sp. B263B2A]
MNASARHPEPAASFVETSRGYFTVTLGHETRAITKEGPASYIAWIGSQDRHWCFAKALKACVEDIEFRLSEAALAQAAHDEAIASLMQMTSAEKVRLIAKLEAERDWLDWSGSEVNVTARKAQFDKQISTLRTI